MLSRSVRHLGIACQSLRDFHPTSGGGDGTRKFKFYCWKAHTIWDLESLNVQIDFSHVQVGSVCSWNQKLQLVPLFLVVKNVSGFNFWSSKTPGYPVTVEAFAMGATARDHQLGEAQPGGDACSALVVLYCATLLKMSCWHSHRYTRALSWHRSIWV